MSDIFQIIVQSNTLNFIIVLAVIIFVAKKLDVNSQVEKIRDEIKAYVDESSTEKENAEKELEAINKKIEKLPDEIAAIKVTTEKNISGLKERIEAEIKEKMVDIDNNAKRIFDLETKKFKSKITGIISEKSIELAKKNAIEQLENNHELHNLYINEAIEEIDKVSL